MNNQDYKFSLQSKILFFLVIVGILFAITSTYERYVIRKDFQTFFTEEELEGASTL